MKSAPEADTRILAALLGDLLPTGNDTPTIDASQLGAFAAHHGRTSALATLLKIFAGECPDTTFADLDATARETVLARIRRKHLIAFADFFLVAIQCYCLDPAVRQSFGETAVAPFPAGQEVPDGDLELLEAVYERGPIFREAQTSSDQG